MGSVDEGEHRAEKNGAILDVSGDPKDLVKFVMYSLEPSYVKPDENSAGKFVEEPPLATATNFRFLCAMIQAKNRIHTMRSMTKTWKMTTKLQTCVCGDDKSRVVQVPTSVEALFLPLQS